MSIYVERWHKYLRWMGIVLVIAVIIGLHAVWFYSFATTKFGEIRDGFLDLRQWDETSGDTLVLDGEWMFYPYSLIASEAAAKTVEAKPINVPGSWEAIIGSNFGYGSYRLTIRLDPNDKQTYAIYVPSVQSASQLYINGALAGSSGQPASKEADYRPYNVPYIAKAAADEHGMIDIVLEAANYIFQPNSGIELSLQFGEESVIVGRNSTSELMQQLVFTVFILHAVYAVHLYMMGIRKKQLLYLSLLLLIVLLTLAGNGSKLIYEWLPLSYEADFRLKGALLALGGIVLLGLSVHSSAKRLLVIAKRALMVTGFILLCYSALRTGTVSFSTYIVFPLYVLSTLITSIIGIISSRSAPIYRNLYMLFLLTALFSTVVWEYVQLFAGISTIFYPLDLIIAMFCISSLMFKSYLNAVHENKQLADKLQQEDKLKDQFLANTSHELRNPLHGILNLSQTVLEREKSWLDERSVHNLELVQSIGRRMNTLLGDLLDLSRLKEGGIQLFRSSVNVHQVVEKTMESLKYLLHGKAIFMVNEVPAQLKHVHADENRLAQILFNLLHNSIKFTVQGTIAVRADVKEGMLQLSVIDTGVGIESAKLDYIFGSYQQISNQDAAIAASGFGLGLSISKQLVELHGSKLQVRSTVGEGSTFFFSLPFAEEGEQASNEAGHGAQAMLSDVANSCADNGAATAAGVSAPAAPKRASDRVQHDRAKQAHHELAAEQCAAKEDYRINILAVDDEQINLQVLSNILSADHNIHLHCTTSPLEVLEKLADQSWDLIISDVMMPQMSGYALTGHIRETYDMNELPVLLLTARNQSLDVETGLLAGANDYIAKPVNAMELNARVRTLVRLKRSHRERMSMETAWLQAQIKPHFIVNTLNSIVALSTFDQDKMIELVNEFSEYLRASYNTYDTYKLISLKQELKLVRSYLSIQQKRFSGRLLVAWEVDEGIELMLPPLIVQSIVENAVTHGALSRSIGGNMSLTIQAQDQTVHFSIKDNGTGMSEQLIEAVLNGQNKNGTGIYNTNLRLRRHYRTGLSIKSKPDFGTEVAFNIPLY